MSERSTGLRGQGYIHQADEIEAGKGAPPTCAKPAVNGSGVPNPPPAAEVPKIKCRCGAEPRLAHNILDPRNGGTLRMYKCQCGEQTWASQHADGH
jgi:hypothetical protein